jgi:hypothetical protein
VPHRILTAGLCLVLAVGCAKRTVPTAAPVRDEVARAQPQPAPAVKAVRENPKKDEKDEANWLTDPRFKKAQPTVQMIPPADQSVPADGPSATGKQPWGMAPPAGGWPGAAPALPPAGAQKIDPPVQPVPGNAPPAPNPPVAGAPQPNVVPGKPASGAATPLAAANNLVKAADMRDLQIFIHDASLVSGQMPTPGAIYAALVDSGSPAADLVKGGAIILTAATRREGVWAYETRALTQGGLVVSQNGVETLSAAELRQRIGK